MLIIKCMVISPAGYYHKYNDYCEIQCLSVQDDGDGCESTSKDELPQPRGF